MKKITVHSVGVDKPVKIVFMPTGDTIVDRRAIDKQSEAKAIAYMFYRYLPVQTVLNIVEEIAKYRTSDYRPEKPEELK